MGAPKRYVAPVEEYPNESCVCVGCPWFDNRFPHCQRLRCMALKDRPITVRVYLPFQLEQPDFNALLL